VVRGLVRVGLVVVRVEEVGLMRGLVVEGLEVWEVLVVGLV
jgi:hypothetical protein